jgi:hypothetical protein
VTTAHTARPGVPAGSGAMRRRRHPGGPCGPVRVFVACLLTIASAGAARGQPKTDVVTLANGDRITGEIVTLERGRLEFKTDDAGTLTLEWDKLASLVATRRFEVLTTDGLRYVGSLGGAPERSITVSSETGAVPLLMAEVTLITPIGRGFWRQLEGTIDAGYSYSRSSGVGQLNLNSTTTMRRVASRARLTASLTQTEKDDDGGRDDRAAVELSYLRYPWQRWFVLGAGRFESNESLGLVLRSQAGAAIGPRLVNSNRAQVVAGAGLAVNNEQGVDVEATQNVEALLMFGSSYFRYDRPKTNFDFNLQYYPSLSNAGRQRLQTDGYVRREVFKDLFISLNGYYTLDTRPPNAAFDSNDVGIVWSIGWSY